MLKRLSLSLEEVSRLKELQRNEKYKKDYVKVTTLLMLNLGCGFDLVGKSLGIDSSTVRRYLNTYVNVGLDNYLESNYHINTGKLTLEQKDLLKLELVENLHLTSHSICDWLKVEFDVIYTAEGLVPLLHKLGFSYKKTKLDPCKYDIEKQLEFVEEFKKLNDSLLESEAIYFSDAVHPQHNTKSSYGY